MAEEQKVETQEVTLKHGGRIGQRIFIDANGQQHILGPGQEKKVTLAAPEAKRMKDIAAGGGGDVIVDGTDPAEAQKAAAQVEAPPATPEEHSARASVAAKEAELMEAGQEAGKERAERWAKKDSQQAAAESGIGVLSRGPDALETVAVPPDAPPKAEREKLLRKA